MDTQLAISDDRSLDHQWYRKWLRNVCGTHTHIPLAKELEAVNVLPALVNDLQRITVASPVLSDLPSDISTVVSKYLPIIIMNPPYRNEVLASFHNKEKLVVPRLLQWRLVIANHPDWKPPFPVILANEYEDETEKLAGDMTPVNTYTDNFIKAAYLQICNKFLGLQIKGYNC
jgi:hypothetical protein